MKKLIFLVSFMSSIIFTSCYTLQPATVIKNDTIDNYQYVIIPGTESLTSSSGSMYNNVYTSTSKTVNPRDVITGNLIKKGFIVLTEVQNELIEKTLIVNYGESGRRDLFIGYTTEITIQFISPQTKKIIFTTTAEGIGSTEADDTKIAINRALDALFEE